MISPFPALKQSQTSGKFPTNVFYCSTPLLAGFLVFTCLTCKISLNYDKLLHTTYCIEPYLQEVRDILIWCRHLELFLA